MFGNPEERTYRRNWRLLNRDLPWLWAVKREWRLEKNDIRVQKADEWMHFLTPWLKRDSISANAEFWIHCHRLWEEKVIRIECDPEQQTSLAARILDASKGFAPGLLYFVDYLIRVDQIVDREIIEVFRPPRSSSCFNDLLCGLADMAVIDKYHALVVK